MLKFVEIVNCSVNDFISKDIGGLLNCSIRVLWLEFMQHFTKLVFLRGQIWSKFAFLADLL